MIVAMGGGPIEGTTARSRDVTDAAMIAVLTMAVARRWVEAPRDVADMALAR